MPSKPRKRIYLEVVWSAQRRTWEMRVQKQSARTFAEGMMMALAIQEGARDSGFRWGFLNRDGDKLCVQRESLAEMERDARSIALWLWHWCNQPTEIIYKRKDGAIRKGKHGRSTFPRSTDPRKSKG